MCEILREHAVNARYKKYDKNIKIPAVIPIVLYNGEEKWVVPKEFRKMIYNEELFGSNILNFTYDVFDISNDEKLEIARNMMKLGLDIDTIIKATGLSKEEIIEKLNIKE